MPGKSSINVALRARLGDHFRKLSITLGPEEKMRLLGNENGLFVKHGRLFHNLAPGVRVPEDFRGAWLMNKEGRLVMNLAGKEIKLDKWGVHQLGPIEITWKRDPHELVRGHSDILREVVRKWSRRR